MQNNTNKVMWNKSIACEWIEKMQFTYQAYKAVRVEDKIMLCGFLISNERMHTSDLQGNL